MQKNNRIVLLIVGATTEVATLKQALSEAEKKTAAERTERDRLGAQVGEVQQELQALMKKHESLELESKTQASELAAALETAKSAKAEAQKALQELEEVKKIAAGKAFFMQSRNIKETTCCLPESGALQGHSQIFPAAYPMPPHSTELKREAQ